MFEQSRSAEPAILSNKIKIVIKLKFEEHIWAQNIGSIKKALQIISSVTEIMFTGDEDVLIK